jgi:hypothetical protein
MRFDPRVKRVMTLLDLTFSGLVHYPIGAKMRLCSRDSKG